MSLIKIEGSCKIESKNRTAKYRCELYREEDEVYCEVMNDVEIPERVTRFDDDFYDLHQNFYTIEVPSKEGSQKFGFCWSFNFSAETPHEWDYGADPEAFTEALRGEICKAMNAITDFET